MSWVDHDFKKLMAYAKALGLKVRIIPGEKAIDQSAEYDPYNKSIDLYEFSSQSKTFMILCFLHELGHHREFLDRNQKDSDLLLDALDAEKPNKAQRLAIYNSEAMASFYMPVVASELNLKIPTYKVKAESMLDKWIAQYYYETGKQKTQKENREKRKELRELCKKENTTN